MHKGLGILTLLVTLALVAPGGAQQQKPASSFFTGVDPRDIRFKPIDTSNAFRTPRQPKAFSLTNLFHKFTLPSWPPKVASAPILPADKNPFQKVPPKPVNIFDGPFTTPKKK